MAAKLREVGRQEIGVFSPYGHTSTGKQISWTTEDFIRTHLEVRESGKYNFQGCKIPIPTSIRYDRIEVA